MSHSCWQRGLARGPLPGHGTVPIRGISSTICYPQGSSSWGGQTIYSDWDLVKYGRVYNLSVEKARLSLGFAPRVSREQGMRETLQWMTDQVQIR